MKPILVQMHGEPGSGKTTLATALAPRIPAIHIDKDVIMTAMIRSRLPREVAGPVSYETIWEFAGSLLSQGYSVIVDSPAYWPQIEGRGRGVARNGQQVAARGRAGLHGDAAFRQLDRRRPRR